MVLTRLDLYILMDSGAPFINKLGALKVHSISCLSTQLKQKHLPSQVLTLIPSQLFPVKANKTPDSSSQTLIHSSHSKSQSSFRIQSFSLSLISLFVLIFVSMWFWFSFPAPMLFYLFLSIHLSVSKHIHIFCFYVFVFSFCFRDFLCVSDFAQFLFNTRVFLFLLLF